MLSQALINDIVKGSKEVFRHMVGRIRTAVMHRLSNSGIDPTEVSGLVCYLTRCLTLFMALKLRISKKNLSWKN